MEAFVYCWTDNITGKIYIGYHKGTIDDGYICSSKLMLEQHRSRPQDFFREILIIGKLEYIREMEIKLLKSVNAAKNPLYYNQSNGSKEFYIKNHTSESKKKISIANKGKIRPPLTEEQRKKRSEQKGGIKNPNYGKQHSKESKEKMKLALKGRIPWNKGKKILKPLTEEEAKILCNIQLSKHKIKNYS